jgi:AraC-like DNA-binding protein
MNWALRHPIPLAEVWLPRSAPREADEYEHLFGAPVRFSAPSAALLFDTRVLAEPISRHPDEVESFLATAPLGLLDEYGSGQPYAEQVRQLLRARLGIEAGSADDVAAQMGMSRQTLHRRLREEGASLSNLKNEVLRDAAVESLGKAEETITALSHRLGFSEPGAFTRAFRRWTGMPPSAYRSTRADRGERAVGFV